MRTHDDIPIQINTDLKACRRCALEATPDRPEECTGDAGEYQTLAVTLKGGPYDGDYPYIRLAATELVYPDHHEGRYLPTGRLVPTVMGNAKEVWEWTPATSIQGADDAEGSSSAGDVGQAPGAVEDVPPMPPVQS